MDIFSIILKLHKHHSKRAWRKIIVSVCLSYCAFSLLATASLSDDESYSGGLKAYLAGNYELAQSHWLAGARANDAKSMFNLGLLHEQEKVANANLDKALEWFRLAGDRGYAAADYHLAVWLEQRGEKTKAAELMQRAAEREYAPAKQRLSGVLSRHSKHTQAPSSGVPSSESEFNSEAWINSKPGHYWTIQMLAFKDYLKVQSFIKDHGLEKNAAYFVERSSDGIFYKLIYGAYNTKDKADFARQNLSADLRAHGPWLRPIASVQEAIKAR